MSGLQANNQADDLDITLTEKKVWKMIGHDLRKPLCVIRELAKVTGSIVRDSKISQVFVEELCEKEYYT